MGGEPLGGGHAGAVGPPAEILPYWQAAAQMAAPLRKRTAAFAVVESGLVTYAVIMKKTSVAL